MRPAGGVQAHLAVGFHHQAMRAHPVGLAAAAGEIPPAVHHVAAVDRAQAAGVGRAPGHDGLGIGIDRMRRLRRQEGGDQGGAVGDEHVPGDGGVGLGDFLQRQQIVARRHLVAAVSPRQQHAKQARSVQRAQQRFGNPPRPLDLVRRLGEQAGEFARAGARVGSGDLVHRGIPRSLHARHCGRAAAPCQCPHGVAGVFTTNSIARTGAGSSRRLSDAFRVHASDGRARGVD